MSIFVLLILLLSAPFILSVVMCVLSFRQGDKSLGFLCLEVILVIILSVPFVLSKCRSCPDCGYSTLEDWCQECGAELIIHCPGCDEKYPGKVPAFCPECGTNLKEVHDAN